MNTNGTGGGGQASEVSADGIGLSTHVDAGVLTVSLDRAAKKNAFTGAMYDALADAFERLAADESLRCLLIRAEGDAFSAGNDLNDFLELDSLGDDVPVVRLLHALPRCEKPIVAAVDGAAVGIGTTLLLHCDLVYATPDARFAVPFVPLGLVPEAGSSRLLPELLGHRRAMAMFLLGETLSAEDALDCGLVNRLVERADLGTVALEAATRIAALPAAAVQATRRLVRAEPVSVAATIERENRLFSERLADPETRAAIVAVRDARRRR